MLAVDAVEQALAAAAIFEDRWSHALPGLSPDGDTRHRPRVGGGSEDRTENQDPPPGIWTPDESYESILNAGLCSMCSRL